jgi:hypothetical protein
MAFFRQEKHFKTNKTYPMVYVSCNYLFPDAKWIHLIFFDKETLVHSLPFITLEFKFNAAVGFAEMYLNDVVVKEIRTKYQDLLVK